jgi:hypothetical protein
MKDKQTVYEDCTRKHLGNNPQGTRTDIVFDAMDEYASIVGVGFAEWKDKNYLKSVRKDRLDKYYSRADKDKNNGLLEYLTLDQLFDKYLEYLKQQSSTVKG